MGLATSSGVQILGLIPSFDIFSNPKRFKGDQNQEAQQHRSVEREEYCRMPQASTVSSRVALFEPDGEDAFRRPLLKGFLSMVSIFECLKWKCVNNRCLKYDFLI